MELWDKHDVAEFLGIRLDSVNGWLARHRIKPVDRKPAGMCERIADNRLLKHKKGPVPLKS